MEVKSSLEIVQGSKAWSKEYKLPLIPAHDNPWAYMAYITKLMYKKDKSQIPFHYVTAFYRECERSIGLIHRYPNQKGGVTSFDELMGAAYLSPMFADRIRAYLEAHYNIYNNSFTEKSKNPLRFWIGRFIYPIPFIRVCSSKGPRFYDTFILAAVIFFDGLFAKENAGGRLNKWIMFEKLEPYKLCRCTIKFWKIQMRKKKITLKKSVKAELQIPELIAIAKQF